MSAADDAYSKLKDDIIQWVLVPETPLAEVEQAERLGVSRTPLREALARLSAEGLVTEGKGRTMMVAPVSIRHVEALFDLRDALEPHAARLAARKRDTEAFLTLRKTFLDAIDRSLPDPTDPYSLSDLLDVAIDESVGSEYLHSALQSLRGMLLRARRLASLGRNRLEKQTQEQLVIIEAIIEGDEARASRAMNANLRNMKKYFLRANR